MRARRKVVAAVALTAALSIALGVGLWLLLFRPLPEPTGPIQLYFTQPVYPDRPDRRHGGIDERLVALISSAQTTIDAAAYDFDLENVARALAVAQRRGVRVRFVTDTDTWASDNPEVRRAWAILREAGIPVVDDRRGPIMHHKFMVVDGEWVWTGSWNWTTGDTYRSNNHAIRIRSSVLGASYTAEFDQMFVGRRFGPSKGRRQPMAPAIVEGVTFQPYFAPGDAVASRIVERIGETHRSIDFLAFSFTSDRIGQAMLDRARFGVRVRGVFESTGSQTRFSEFARLRGAGLEVYQDGNPYAMHHKVIVLDERTVLFGSYNFSSNADEENDENILFVEDAGLAERFLAEVERVVAQARTRPASK